jgi:glycine/D-amino acid oxidase-like deaminating enzyme
MRRREVLHVFAGLALAGVPRLQAAATRVVVAGAGIIGASIAYYLARRGAAVTIVDRAQPGTGATANSFAWMNATFSKRPRTYFELNRLGLQCWRELDVELNGRLQVRWGGSAEWYPDGEEARRLHEQVRGHQAWGYATRIIAEDELRRLEPEVAPGLVAAAALSEQEGHVDPVHATRTLVEAARSAGATMVAECDVTAIDRPGGRLRAIATSKGGFEADTLVVACGVDTPRVARLAGLTIPLQDSPGLLAHTMPLPPLINRVVLAPGAHMKQKPDGRVVTGVGFGAAGSTDASRETGQKALAAAARFLPELASAPLDKVTLGWRPLPTDGFPVIGSVQSAPGVYVTVMHSGVTLSPLVGRLVATELLDGVDVDLLEPFRPARFT